MSVSTLQADHVSSGIVSESLRTLAPPALLALDTNSNYVPVDDDSIEGLEYPQGSRLQVGILTPLPSDDEPPSSDEPDSENSGEAVEAPAAYDLPVPEIGGWGQQQRSC